MRCQIYQIDLTKDHVQLACYLQKPVSKTHWNLLGVSVSKTLAFLNFLRYKLDVAALNLAAWCTRL